MFDIGMKKRYKNITEADKNMLMSPLHDALSALS